jgi:hypothetical protein
VEAIYFFKRHDVAVPGFSHEPIPEQEKKIEPKEMLLVDAT